LYSLTQAGADRRALTAAALAGSFIGLALGAAYLAGGLARTATDHARASRLAVAASEGFSEAALQGSARDMGPGVLRVARRHDPITSAGAAERDRQNVLLATRLERDERSDPRQMLLRASFDLPALSTFRLSGALDQSRELECLTQAVYFEARGETPAGQAAVAQVVLNRVRHPAFPKSVCAVVFQGAGRHGCQFSFACNGAMRKGHEVAAWSRARRVASRALAGLVVADIGSATHFHTTSVSPGWGPSLQRVGQVGLHVFYRLGRGGFRIAPDASEPELTSEPAYAAPTPPAADPSAADLRLTSMRLEAPLATQTAPAAAEAGVEAAGAAPAGRVEKAAGEAIPPSVTATS
jgi:spore germination cell wall hydrolase CwlJ-like protein